MEERLNFLNKGVKPRKNKEVMNDVMDELKKEGLFFGDKVKVQNEDDDAPAEEEEQHEKKRDKKKKEKKEKKSKKAAEDSEDFEEGEKPKKKKKKSKD